MVKIGQKLALVALVTVILYQGGECIRCLSCKNIIEPTQCETTIECQENQTCYIESVMTLQNGYQLEYNLGCKPLTTCNLVQCSKDLFEIPENSNKTNTTKSKRDISVCNDCCYENNCNAEGCGFKQKIGVTKCYDCKDVHEGGPPCNKLMDCDLTTDTCSVTISQHSRYPGAYDLGCTRKLQCEVLLSLQGESIDTNAKCCRKFLCNGDPYSDTVNATSVLALTCPPDLVTPPTPPTTPTTQSSTTTPLTTLEQTTQEKTTTTTIPTTTPKPTTTTTIPTTTPTPPTTTPKPTTTTTIPTTPPTPATTTPKPTTTTTIPTTTPTTTTTTTLKPTTTTTIPTTTTTIPTTTTPKPTTPIPTTTPTTVGTTTEPPPKTLPPVTKKCHACSGPDFLCEQLYDPIDCDPPNNYCINKIVNHKDGSRDVTRGCGSFDTCYKDWFQGSSDRDRCRQFNQDDESQLDFECTFCCIEDLCNDNLHPPNNLLYRPK